MSHLQYEEKGYLHEDFKIFYLEQLAGQEIQYHYHNFDKIIFFFKGDVTYTVEGKAYRLLPNDIVLVPRGDSHKVEGKGEYTRLVFYLSPEYIGNFTHKKNTLRDCFENADKIHSHVFRFKDPQFFQLSSTLRDTLLNQKEESFFHLKQQTLLLQLLIALNQMIDNHQGHFVNTSNCNQKIVEIIHYINKHLTEDLDIDRLSQTFYISKYYMMRQFKAETGYTIGNYINQKRLLYARELLKQGTLVTEAYLDAGFKDYSTFSRAYKQMFAEVPSKLKK